VQARDGSSGLALFAAELQAARGKAGWSQDQLAARINWSASAISMIEGCRRVPRLDLAKKLDEVFEMAGTFERLQEYARTMPVPSWFRPFVEVEAVATQLRLWEHAIIPGLLQTEGYARAMLAEEPNITAEVLEDLLSARLARQSVLTRDSGSPLVWALVDESALLRGVGGAKVMYGQLMHLVKMSGEPAITIQVVPLDTGAHPGMSGAFAVADVDGAGGIAYLETVADGYIAEDAATVRRISVTFDTLRAVALPVRASRELIMTRAGDYGPE
jgi:transcriptional regulator with XRE-family HTH domain